LSVSKSCDSRMQRVCFTPCPKSYFGWIQWVIGIHTQLNRNFVGAKSVHFAIIFDGEAIVEQETVVALLTV